MREWFRWRTIVGSIALGALFAGVLFLVNDEEFRLSGLDLFFGMTTVLSIGVNLWQLFRDKYKYSPLKNSLIGLFNDLKGRQLRAYNRQNLIYAPAAANTSVDALRIEFYDFVQETVQGLEQLREHVVADIHMLDPEASNQQVFRAAEFGLNEQEKRFREESNEQLLENARRAREAAASQGQLAAGGN